MKHLLLYEAFKSKGIYKTLKYLSDSDIPKESFLDDLKILLNKYDLPISDLTDNEIHYMNQRKAKNIKPSDDYEIMNTHNVYTIKFWFSISDGYLGSSILYNKLDNVKNIENTELSDEDILSAENLGLRGGYFNKITTKNITELKTGDIIIGRFSSRYESLTKAIFFKSDNDSEFYAIQDKYDGDQPNTSVNDWKKYGEYAWSIGSSDHLGNNRLGDDSHDLHSFHNIDGEVQLSGGSIYLVNNSDFCLVIYLDDLVNNDSVTDIRGERKELKSGALALMDPEEIKSANYERYMSGILKKMGIYNDSKFDDLKSLEKIAQKVVLDNWALFSIYCDEPGINQILKFSDSLKDGIFTEVMDIYNYILSKSKNCVKKFIGSSNRIKNRSNKESLDIIKMYYDLSHKLNKKIKGSNLETLEDLILIHYKLSSLCNFLRKDINLSTGLKKILDNFYYDDYDVNDGIEVLNASSNDEKESDINSYKLIDRFIDKLF